MTMINFLTSKCEYVDLADPCKVCREKGWRCTATDKVWDTARRFRQQVECGSGASPVINVLLSTEDDGIEEIPRAPGTPIEDTLSHIHGLLLQRYKGKIHRP